MYIDNRFKLTIFNYFQLNSCAIMKNSYSSGYFGAFRKAVEMRVHVFTQNKLVKLEPLFSFSDLYDTKTKIA